jgi:fatty-acyl-CoA synthase
VTTPGPPPLGELVRQGALRSPGTAAIRMLDGPTRTYGELDARTDRIANALLGAGVAPGERVGLWLENSLDYLELYFACLKAGLVVVQLNVRHTEHEAQYQLEHSGTVALVFDDAAAERVERLPGRDALRLLLATGRERVAGALGYDDFVAAARPGMPVSASAPSPDDVAVLAYTSGTTGFPKGARLTHRSIRSIGQTNQVANRYAIGSVQVFALSLSFAAGIPAHVLPHLAVGGTTILMPNFDTERLVDALEREHATFTLIPGPPIVEFCRVVSEGGHRLPSLVSLLHGTAKAPEEHLELLADTIGPRLVEGWGMTENSGGLVAATSQADYADRRPGIFSSTGRAVPGTVVRLVGTEGEPLPHDGTTVGQLVFRSDSLADGYWNDPDASAAAFEGGWYRSGDLGTIDAEGYIEVLDRRSDLIVSGGMNVYPSEVERVILQLPGVAECSVVGVPHERWGQTPVAHVVRTAAGAASGQPDAERIAAHCRERLAGYKQPREIVFTEALPRNAGGKVMRNRLRDAARGAGAPA